MSKQNKIHIDYTIRKRDLVAMLCGAVVALMAFFFVIIAFTPLRYTIPGYPSREMTDQIRNDRMLMDSLQRSLYRWDLYTTNLRKVLEGETPVPLDSLLRQAASVSSEEQTLEMSAADSTLRSIMTEQEIFNIEEEDVNDTDIEGRHFFRPLNGVVSVPYDVMQHPYLEVVAPDGSSIKSVLDGTVISTDWSASEGWSMIIQHGGGIISIYRNCNVLLKKVADKVSAGTAVAVLGSSAEQGGTGMLHFEMWSSGESVDPAEYIKF